MVLIKNNFSEQLLSWYEQYKRDLPWRKTYTPYHVWISEIMLQQTQMTRGVVYFERWMQRFPTIVDVASATIEELYSYWEGLGYYSRVRNVHATARRIVEEYNGNIPKDYTLLRSLPGIGDYTAGAIASIAFELPVPAVDANVIRIISRVYGIHSCIQEKCTQEQINRYTTALLPKNDARTFNQAMMELGALVCKKTPLCLVCPIQNLCYAYINTKTSMFPVNNRKIARIAFNTIAIILVHNNTVFLRKRANRGVWANFWEFPEYKQEDNTIPEYDVVQNAFMHEYVVPITITEHALRTKYTYTNKRVTMDVFYAYFSDAIETIPYIQSLLSPQQEYIFASIDELQKYTLSSGHNRIRTKYLQNTSPDMKI